METRQERLSRRSQEIGSKHQRKLRRYSPGFYEKFSFFLKAYRDGILSFSGSVVEVKNRKNGPDAREAFRMYEDGQFRKMIPYSKHPLLFKAIISGKKSWGLWVDQWTDGIVDWSFTEEDILNEFEKRNIKIPESFLQDFKNTIQKKKQKRNEKYFQEFFLERI